MKTKIRNLSMEKVFVTPALELQIMLGHHLAEKKRKVFQGLDYVYSPGKFPVLLVAHMDTVHKAPPTICKSADGLTWMAPEGIGGDDRAGIWIILNILENFDCHVVFTQGEEVGGIGADAFRKSGHYPKVNFLVEVDRHGADDAVFYDCGNDDFIDFVCETTTYKERMGTFTDISILAPWLDRAAVNLSAGYYNEHTAYERVDLNDMAMTTWALGELLKSEGAKNVYKYDEVIWTSRGYYGSTTGYGKGALWHGRTWDNGEYDDWSSRGYTDNYGGYLAKTAEKAVKTITPAKDVKTVKEVEEDEYEGFYREMFDEAVRNCLVELVGFVPDQATMKAVSYAVEDVLFEAGYLPVD